MVNEAPSPNAQRGGLPHDKVKEHLEDRIPLGGIVAAFTAAVFSFPGMNFPKRCRYFYSGAASTFGR